MLANIRLKIRAGLRIQLQCLYGVILAEFVGNALSRFTIGRNVVYFCPFSFFRMDLLVFFMVCGVALFGSCTSGNAEWPPAAYKRIVECIPTGKPPTPSPPLNVAFCLALKVLRNLLHSL